MALSVVQPLALPLSSNKTPRGDALQLANRAEAAEVSVRDTRLHSTAGPVVASSRACPICHRECQGRHRLGLYWRKFGYAGPEYCALTLSGSISLIVTSVPHLS